MMAKYKIPHKIIWLQCHHEDCDGGDCKCFDEIDEATWCQDNINSKADIEYINKDEYDQLRIQVSELTKERDNWHMKFDDVNDRFAETVIERDKLKIIKTSNEISISGYKQEMFKQMNMASEAVELLGKGFSNSEAEAQHSRSDLPSGRLIVNKKTVKEINAFLAEHKEASDATNEDKD